MASHVFDGVLQGLRREIRAAIRELPAESLACGVATCALLYAIHTDFRSIIAFRLMAAAVLAAPLLVAVTLARRAGRLPASAALLARVAAGGVAFAIAAVSIFERPPAVWVVWCLATSALFTCATPFAVAALVARRGERSEAFSALVRSFAEACATVGLFCASAMIALGVIFFALQALFNLRVQYPVAYAYALIAGISSLQLLHLILANTEERKVPRIWRMLVTTVHAPFVAVMMTIVAAYQIFVLFSGDVPKNVLSPLLIATGVVGIASALIIQSMLGQDERPRDGLAPEARRRWERELPVQVVRWFPLVLAALLPMAVWAILIRIDQYGMTPFRAARLYTLLALGAICAAGVFRLARRLGPISWEAPVIVLLAAGTTAFGPLSGPSMTIASQSERLRATLAREKIDAARSPADDANYVVSYEVQLEIWSQMESLIDVGGSELVEQAVGRKLDCHSPYGCTEALGIISNESGHGFSDREWEHKHSNFDTPTALPSGEYVRFELPNSAVQPTWHLQFSTDGRVELWDSFKLVASTNRLEPDEAVGRYLPFVAASGGAADHGGVILNSASLSRSRSQPSSQVTWQSAGGMWRMPPAQP